MRLTREKTAGVNFPSLVAMETELTSNRTHTHFSLVFGVERKMKLCKILKGPGFRLFLWGAEPPRIEQGKEVAPQLSGTYGWELHSQLTWEVPTTATQQLRTVSKTY